MPFIDASEMLQGAPLPGWSGRFFHSANMTFAHWDIAADAADLHEHHHPQEEVWNIVEGEVILVVDGEERRMVAGAAAVVTPTVHPLVKLFGPCRAVIADYPLRPDLPGVRRTD